MPNCVIVFHEIPSKLWFYKIIKQIKYIYNTVSIKSIKSYMEFKINLHNSCHLTFDDGHISFYEYAYPIIKEYNIPVSLFVSPKIIINNEIFWFNKIQYLLERYGSKILIKHISRIINIKPQYLLDYSIWAIIKSLKQIDIEKLINKIGDHSYVNNIKLQNISKNQLIEISNNKNINIGAHSLNHPILSNESINIVKNEIIESVSQLSNIINKNVSTFAYPNGILNLDFREREIDILKNIHISLSFSTVNNSFNRLSNPLAIPRVSAKSINEHSYKFFARILLLSQWTKIRKIVNKNKDYNHHRQRLYLHNKFYCK